MNFRLNVEHVSGETLWSYPKSGDEFAPTVALAFQNEGTLATDVLSSVTAIDNTWSPSDTIPVGSVLNDFYATGASGGTFDALSMEFNPNGADLSQGALRVYLQKGSGPWSSWEHYVLLPGIYNPTDQDSYDLASGTDHYPGGELANDTSVGWVDLPFNESWNPEDLGASEDNIGLTLRLWNWRVDAVKLVQLSDISISLVEGPNTFVVTAEDGTGAESTDSITITLDTVPPDAPIITTDGGNGPGVGFYTSNPELTLQGTCEAETAYIMVNESTEGVRRVEGVTTWSYEARLQHRENTFVVTAKDEAGNLSPADTIAIDFGGIIEGAPMSDIVPACTLLIVLATFFLRRTQRTRTPKRP